MNCRPCRHLLKPMLGRDSQTLIRRTQAILSLSAQEVKLSRASQRQREAERVCQSASQCQRLPASLKSPVGTAQKAKGYGRPAQGNNSGINDRINGAVYLTASRVIKRDGTLQMASRRSELPHCAGDKRKTVSPCQKSGVLLLLRYRQKLLSQLVGPAQLPA